MTDAPPTHDCAEHPGTATGMPVAHDALTVAQLRALVAAAASEGCPDDARVRGRFGEQWCIALTWDAPVDASA